jgi:hypothetical protein
MLTLEVFGVFFVGLACKGKGHFFIKSKKTANSALSTKNIKAQETTIQEVD